MRIILTIFILLWASVIQAADVYISPSGADGNAGTSCVAAKKTFTHVMTLLDQDETLWLCDGTYNSDEGALTVAVSGTLGHPINIKAVNDWAATVDGQVERQPLYINANNYINVEGIIFTNSNLDLAKITGASTNINIKRCGFINSNTGNYHVLIIQGISHDILVEDSFMTQVTGGRTGITAYGGAYNLTFRRNYIRYVRHDGGGGPCNLVSIYGANNILMENNFLDGRNMPSDCYGEQKLLGGPARYYDTNYVVLKGNIAIGNAYITHADIHGASAGECQYATGNWEYYNNVYINAMRGVNADDSTNDIYQNNNFINLTTGTNEIALNARYIGCRSTTATVENNSFLTADYALGAQSSTTITADYNNYSAIGVGQTYGSGTITNTNPKTITPAYDTATYGNGAYLIVPSALVGQGKVGADIGAEVIYRYVDGVLTSTPLWPWPMESRICEETGYSVTYETGYGGCALGSGLWKTLSGVYTDIVSPTLPGVTTITASVRDYVNLDLSWNASTDDIGITGYNIYRCAGTCTPADPGDYITQVAGTAYSDNNLAASTTYSYNVKAVDSAGNKSGFYTTKTQATTAAPGSMTYNARQTDRTMTTDANCEEFADAETLTIMNAKIRLMWDSTALYGCAYIADSQVNSSITAHDGDLWTEDSLEMFFDTDNNQGASMTSGDYKLYISATGVKAEEDYVSMANWDPTWTVSTKYGGTLNSNTDTDIMYIVEFAITWANWGLAAPTADSTVWGFDLSENNLNPPNITQTAWSNSTGGGYNDPAGWGTLNFKSNPKTVSVVGSGAATTIGSGASFVLGR